MNEYNKSIFIPGKLYSIQTYDMLHTWLYRGINLLGPASDWKLAEESVKIANKSIVVYLGSITFHRWNIFHWETILYNGTVGEIPAMEGCNYESRESKKYIPEYATLHEIPGYSYESRKK
jgi:hypothetical protein